MPAQRIEQPTAIMLLLPKYPAAEKPCHLAHRFPQTCIPLLSGLCGAVGSSSAGRSRVQAALALTGQYSGFHCPFRCIAVVVQASVNSTQQDWVLSWHDVLGCQASVDWLRSSLMATCVECGLKVSWSDYPKDTCFNPHLCRERRHRSDLNQFTDLTI